MVEKVVQNIGCLFNDLEEIKDLSKIGMGLLDPSDFSPSVASVIEEANVKTLLFVKVCIGSILSNLSRISQAGREDLIPQNTLRVLRSETPSLKGFTEAMEMDTFFGR
jgi:hypothetical protein